MNSYNFEAIMLKYITEFVRFEIRMNPGDLKKKGVATSRVGLDSFIIKIIHAKGVI